MGMEEKHTKGRLHIVGDDECPDNVEVIEIAHGDFGPSHKQIAYVQPGDDRGGRLVLTAEDRANARRLCAAWNATLDIPTAELERGVVAEMRGLTRRLADRLKGATDEIDFLRETAEWESNEADDAADELDRALIAETRALLARLGGAK